MPNPTQQTAENVVEAVDSTVAEAVEMVEDAPEAVDAAAAEIAAEEDASKYRIERAVAGIPDAVSDFVNKEGEEGEKDHKITKAIAGIPDAVSGLVNQGGEGEPDPSAYRIERAVAGVPDALTAIKEKKLAEDAELRAAEGIVEEGEPEHKLEKIIVGIPDQLAALEDDITEHVKPVIEQNSADAKAKSHEIAQGAIMTAAALVIAMFGIPVVLLGIAATLALVIPWWASLLLVGAILLVIALICNSSAKSHFNKAGEIDVSLKAGIRKSFDYLFKGIGMPDEMAEELRESK